MLTLVATQALLTTQSSLGIPEADAAFTRAELDAAIAHHGSPHRVRRVLRAAQAGRPITIAVLGGSISAGSTLGVHHRNGNWLWHGRLFTWFNETLFPHRGHRRFNGAVPASTPAYVDGCLAFHLPKSADLVFVEYTLNTLDWREYERLLRRALSYPKRPAVVLLHMFKQWRWPHTRGSPPQDERMAALAARKQAGMRGTGLVGGDDELSSAKSSRVDPDGDGVEGSFDYGGEARALLLSQYYRVPSISVRNALFRAVMAGRHLAPVSEDYGRRKDAAGRWLPNGSLQVEFMLDRIHPSGKGNALVAGLVAHYLRSQLPFLHKSPPPASLQLQQQQQSEDEDGEEEPELPPPLYFGASSPFEQDREALLCVRGRELLKHLHLPPPPLVNVIQSGASSSSSSSSSLSSALERTGWSYVVEGSAANPKPGLIARAAGRALSICWRPPPQRGASLGGGRSGANNHHKPARYAFKLGYLKSYGKEFGAALLNCSGACACEPTWLDARASARDRLKVSLHSVQNVVLTVLPPGPTPLPSSDPTGGGALPASLMGSATTSSSPGAPMKFKILSFFVGPTAAGKGRLHQQSIVLSDGVNAAEDELQS